jgi:nucleoid-associated protein YgaU
MPRYANRRARNNRTEFYRFLREKRDVNTIVHFDIVPMHNPTPSQRAAISTTTHLWSYGDRYYKIAYAVYGDPRYWWVIAWWNARPTEANLRPGTAIQIPLNLEKILTVLGSY